MQDPTLERAVDLPLPLLGWDLSPETIRNTEELGESFFGSWKHMKFSQRLLVKAES